MILGGSPIASAPLGASASLLPVVSGIGIASLPMLLANSSAELAVAGVGAASLPMFTADVTATAPPSIFAIASASLPMFTGDAVVLVPVFGVTGALLPALVAAGSASLEPEAHGTATLPMLTALAAGMVPVKARGAAALPALAVEAAIVSKAHRPLRSWQECPRPASGFIERGGGDLRRGKLEPA